ncbi:DUF192 domain-containing protein [Marinobacteraceae bacterium S3BR75-40.1]
MRLPPLFLLLALTSVCRADAALSRLETADACIISGDRHIQLQVELAKTPEQRHQGLMERSELEADSGMLFLYPQPRDSSTYFWMYRTWIPLDIAFLSDQGQILRIRHMKPCHSPNPDMCRHYRAGAQFSAALEMRADYFQDHRIETGDVFQLQGNAAGPLAHPDKRCQQPEDSR